MEYCQYRGKRFSFARLHLGDRAAVHDQRAQDLDVEGSHPQAAANGLRSQSKRFFDGRFRLPAQLPREFGDSRIRFGIEFGLTAANPFDHWRVTRSVGRLCGVRADPAPPILQPRPQIVDRRSGYDSSLKCCGEAGTLHAGRLCGPRDDARRHQRTAPVPVVQSRSPRRPVHVLLRLVRARMETAHRSWLSPEKGAGPRSRRLRPLRYRLRIRDPPPKAPFRFPPRGRLGPVGTEAGTEAIPVGRRPHCPRSRRWRRMCPRQHADAMPDLSPPGHF